MARRDSSPVRRLGVIASIVAARSYLFVVLYSLFLTTDLREDRDDFVYTESGQTSKEREAEIEQDFWDRLGPFDGQFYLDIANKGYRTISASIHGDLGNYAFFPLLPGLLALLRLVFSDAYVPLAIGISFVAGVVGTLAVWRLAERLGTSGLLAAAVIVCFPSASFQYVLYTESLFLCFSGLTLVFVVDRRPLPAAVFALLAGLSRPQGILLSIPIFIELVWPTLRSRRADDRIPLSACIATFAPFAGFVVLAIVSTVATGSPFAFLTVQGRWGRGYEVGGILKAVTSVFGYGGPPIDLFGLLVALGCIPIMWKCLPRSLALYGIATVLMPLSTGSILSLARFMSVSVPHLLALAIFLQDRTIRASVVILAVFLTLQTLVARGLMGWYFVG